MMSPPRSFASRNSLPPEGAAAPAARQSQFRGPCLRMPRFGEGLPTPISPVGVNQANFPSSSITSVRLTSASAVDITTLAVISSSATL